VEGVMKNIFALFILSGFLLAGNASSLQNNSITITILYDNYPFGEGLKTDWGFSCIIKGTEKTILFDTGTQSDILFHNVKSLNVNLKNVDLVPLSHNHGDHTGGLFAFLKENNKVSVYVPVSFSDSFKKRVKDSGAKIVSVDEPVEICKNVHLTGELTGPANEQALILDTSKGLVVITGCAHPGIVDMVKRAKEVVKKDVYLVFGGFHLVSKSEVEVKDIIRQFKELGVQKVGATHCTGDLAIGLFKKAYEENFVQMGVGRVIQIKE
jgi:7,8-dihydropterin-6-yl-methyl-4-(beta-D-ribofuranosyl)aminobenzene 5'-phosphate synthase